MKSGLVLLSTFIAIHMFAVNVRMFESSVMITSTGLLRFQYSQERVVGQDGKEERCTGAPRVRVFELI
jgi:hypothetical protein